MFRRGEVHLVSIQLPNRPQGDGGERRKLILLLQDEHRFPTASDVAAVVCSTQRFTDVRSFEVQVGLAEGFNDDTVIDCRWVHTLPKNSFSLGSRQFALSDMVMEEVSEAIVVGLQLY